MKQYFVLLFLALSGFVSSAQEITRIDFQNQIGDSFQNGKIITHESSPWKLKVITSDQSRAFAGISEQSSFEIKGIEGDCSYILKKIPLTKNQKVSISLDLNDGSRDTHLCCEAVYDNGGLNFQNLSFTKADAIVKTNYIIEDGNLELSIDFKNLIATDIFTIDNIEIKFITDDIEDSIPDISSLFYSLGKATNSSNNFIYSTSKQKILSFYIEDDKMDKDKLSTIVNKIKVNNNLPLTTSLSDIFSNIEIYKDGNLLTGVNSQIYRDYLEVLIGGSGLEINDNTRSLIEIFADVRQEVDYGLNRFYGLLLTSDSFITSEKSSQFKKNQELSTPLMSIRSTKKVLRTLYENNFQEKCLSNINNSNNWKIDSLLLGKDMYDYFIRSNGSSSSDNYFAVDMGNVNFETQDISWSFSLNYDVYTPSSRNKFCYVLSSDSPDFTGKYSGYVIGVDMYKSTNRLTIYSVNNGTYNIIEECPLIWGEDMGLDIRVQRKVGGKYTVFYSDMSRSSKYTKSLEFEDKSPIVGRYSGLLYKYSSSSRTENLSLDNLKIAILGEYINYLEKFELGSDSQICLYFSNEVDLNSLLDENSFKLFRDGKQVVCTSIKIVNGHLEIVFPLFGGDYHLEFIKVKDRDGNIVSISDIDFNFSPVGSIGDVMITELFVDPIVPQKEYLELYNQSNNDMHYNFLNLTLNTSFVGTVMRVDNVDIPAHSYILLASADRRVQKYLSSFAKVYPLLHFSLAERGAFISIETERGLLVDSISYTKEWGEVELKGQGRSLERVNINAPNTIDNWVYCRSKDKCTPGFGRESNIDSEEQSNIQCDNDAINHNGTEQESRVLITMHYPETSFRYNIMAFDERGQILYNYSDNNLSRDKTEFIWRGVNNSSEQLTAKVCCVKVTVTKDNGESEQESFIISIL